MKYDRDRKTVRNILKTADLANTLNGGMSQAQVAISRMVDHYLVSACLPGVAIESLQVEIVNKFVIVSHPLEFNHEDGMMEMPHIIATIPISLDVDYKKITATKDDGTLYIRMPFNELAGDYHKRLEINEH